MYKIDDTTPLLGFGAYPGQQIQQPTDTRFDDLLKKLKDVPTASGTQTTPVKHLSQNAKAEDAVKSTVLKLVAQGYDAAKADIESLSEEDKKEALKILQSILDTIIGEIAGDKKSGSSQDLINILFSKVPDSTATTNENSAETLKQIQETLAKLKDSNSNSTEVLSQLVTLLAMLNSQTPVSTDTTPDPNFVNPVEGEVTVKVDSTSYTLKLEDIKKQMQDLVDVLNGKEVVVVPPNPTDPTTPTTPTPPTDGTGTTTPTTPTPPTDGTGTTTPTTPTPPTDGTGTTTPTTPTPPTDGTGTATPTDVPPATEVKVTEPLLTARAITYNTITADNTNGSNKLLSDSNLARSALFSQRVIQKSNEIEAMNLVGAQTASTQSVLQTPVQITAENLSQVPVETQISNNINYELVNLKADTTKEMTMKLNPDNLGEISVKLVNEAGKISVTIAAQSEITQKLLQEKLPSLIANLQNANNEVKDVRIVEANQNSSFAGFNLNNSDAGQRGNDNNTGSQSNYSNAQASQVQGAENTTTSQIFTGGSKLWQTV